MRGERYLARGGIWGVTIMTSWQEELRQFRDAEHLPDLIHRLECYGTPEAVILFAKEAADLILALTSRAESAEGDVTDREDDARDEGYEDGLKEGRKTGRADAIWEAINAVDDLAVSLDGDDVILSKDALAMAIDAIKELS
jgi:hypothetical protein